jgi:tRNA(fMet)-specific endonuclease VapC
MTIKRGRTDHWTSASTFRTKQRADLRSFERYSDRLLDTSVIVRAERRGVSIAEILTLIRETNGEAEVGVSVVTIAELTHGVQRSKSESQRERSQAFVDDVLATINVYPVTTEIAQRVGVISGQEAERGITLPFEDLLIGATALQLGFELATHNVRHFKMIPSLVVKQL